MKNKCIIYGLVDPRDNEIRYIGKTIDISKRLYEHIRSAKKSKPGSTKKNDWIRKLCKHNLEISLIELDCVDIEEWQFWETFYIDLFKSWNFKLTNMTNGGDGVSNPWLYLSNSDKQNRVNKLIKINKSDVRREQMRVARLGKTYEEIFGDVKAAEMKRAKSEFLKQNNPSKRGRIVQPETKELIRKKLQKQYEITFPDMSKMIFTGQKAVIQYFDEKINKNILPTDHKNYISPYTVLRNGYDNYKTIRI